MLVRDLDEVAQADLPEVGGKGANLGELIRAGLPVPPGFILTTEAYEQAARAARVDPSDAADAAERLRAAPVPEAIAAAAVQAYAKLGQPAVAVAVRSSATAEDLPGASFAGQQDTYLNIQGEAALLDAIRRCWASLWNERAVAYRRANAIDPDGVGLAVVVQQMVPASAAGVLFTADPITGQRRRAAIDAIPELGEKLVSGAIDPDHFVIDGVNHRVTQRRSIGSTPVLSDAELLALADMGERVEQHFGAPQDIEFALDADRHIWLVQSRPITTLYPLPEGRVTDLRVYWSANVFQGYFEPLTPMGIQFFQLLGTSVYRGFGARVADPVRGPTALVAAGMRLFVDVTPVVRDQLGRQLFTGIMRMGESRSSTVLVGLGADPRLRVTNVSSRRTWRRILAGVQRVGIPAAALPVLLRGYPARVRYERDMERIARVQLPPNASAATRLDALEWLLLQAAPLLLPRLLGIMAPAMLLLGVASRLLRGLARFDEVQTLTRGAPHNPTTEMDLALWSLCARVRIDTDSRSALLEREPAELSAAYLDGRLPPRLQRGLAEFLSRYGFRCIGEIDIGVKRWSEDPSHILGALANYVRLEDESVAPDAQFARGQREAEATLDAVVARAHGPRRLLIRVVLRRMRALIGGREAPKFHIIRLLATPARQLLQAVGNELAAAGRIAAADDIFFLTLPEARSAVAGADLREIVAARRQQYQREHLRRRIPRILLSDGTDAEAAVASITTPDDDGLRGSPASPGVASGVARVIHSPVGARLEPGEILVAPSTDPGWTPLFLTAGGLVMEMGGMMSHGAVVAREYGIPAVVGVPAATERISTGQRLRVDGSSGTITLEG
jgi:pyruvate,water dikinase